MARKRTATAHSAYDTKKPDTRSMPRWSAKGWLKVIRVPKPAPAAKTAPSTRPLPATDAQTREAVRGTIAAGLVRASDKNRSAEVMLSAPNAADVQNTASQPAVDASASAKAG